MSTENVHRYAVSLVWEGNRGSGTSGYESYDRRFRVVIEGKADLLGSADPTFRGDPRLPNPEELLLTAVASCHMLFYLSLCAKSGISVVRYSDAAVGRLVITPACGGAFEEVTLHPHVTISRTADPAAAAALHGRAGELCFIANSCRFPISHQPEVDVE